MSLADKHRQILFEAERAVPFSSMSGLYKHVAGEHDPRFGASCGGQAMELIRRLRRDIGELLPAEVHGGHGIVKGHLLVIADDDKQRLVMDPCAFMREPAEISPCFPMTVECYRTESRQPRTYEVSCQRADTRHLSCKVLVGGGLATQYFINAAAPVAMPDEPEPIDADTALLRQDFLRIYALGPDGIKTHLRVDPESGCMDLLCFGQKIWDTDTHRFQAGIDHLAGLLRTEPGKLLEYVHGAIDLHQSIHGEEPA